MVLCNQSGFKRSGQPVYLQVSEENQSNQQSQIQIYSRHIKGCSLDQKENEIGNLITRGLSNISHFTLLKSAHSSRVTQKHYIKAKAYQLHESSNHMSLNNYHRGSFRQPMASSINQTKFLSAFPEGFNLQHILRNFSYIILSIKYFSSVTIISS